MSLNKLKAPVRERLVRPQGLQGFALACCASEITNEFGIDVYLMMKLGGARVVSVLITRQYQYPILWQRTDMRVIPRCVWQVRATPHNVHSLSVLCGLVFVTY